VQEELGLSRRIELKLGGTEQIPFVWGLRRPSLVLPAKALTWDADRLRMVLSHELAHVVRHDLLRLILIDLACALSWFNPVVWVAARRARLEMEHACDDMVLRGGTPGPAYARELLWFAAQLGRRTIPLPAPLAMARPSNLEARMARILDPHARRRPLNRTAAAVVCVVLLMTALPLVGVTVVGKAGPRSAEHRGGHQAATVTGSDELTTTDIHTAARRGDIVMVTAILDRHPHLLNARDARGMTPLSAAAWESRLDVVALLISRGADLDAKNAVGLTPLFCALDRGRRSLAQILMDAGADVHATGFRGRSMLHMAARAGMRSICRRLIEMGADVNAEDTRGVTPLELAVWGRHPGVVGLLQVEGADGDINAIERANPRTAKERVTGRKGRSPRVIKPGAESGGLGEAGWVLIDSAGVAG
jgi:hypothetical protein